MAAIANSSSLVNGGAISCSSNMLVNGLMVAKVGDPVATHPSGTGGYHVGAVLATGSSIMKVNGVPVCRIGDLASCGHPIDLGSAFLQVNA